MRAFLLVVLVFVAFCTEAVAEQNFVQLKTVIQPGPLRDACNAAKGKYSVAPDGKSYSCVKKNCDGKGGDCAVACTGDSCTGVTPARIVNTMSLREFLQGGREQNLTRKPAAGGGGSIADPTFPTTSRPTSDDAGDDAGTLY